MVGMQSRQATQALLAVPAKLAGMWFDRSFRQAQERLTMRGVDEER